MKHGIYLIRDTALGAFLTPNFFQSEGAARRAFADAVNESSPNNMIHKHPEHFELYYAGDFDDETGMLSEAVLPQHLVSAISLVIPSEPRSIGSRSEALGGA